jgi:hypothetical protein
VGKAVKEAKDETSKANDMLAKNIVDQANSEGLTWWHPEGSRLNCQVRQ